MNAGAAHVDGRERSAAIRHQRNPARRADPHRVAAIDRDVEDECVAQRRECDAVEARQSVLRADPDVAVARLRDRLHGRLRQSVVGAPDAMSELRDRRVRIEREERAGDGRDRDCGGDAARQHSSDLRSLSFARM